jgi:hypothetical protein
MYPGFSSVEVAVPARSGIEAELDRLYGLPLTEFVPARNQIAAELRQKGDEEGAARVAGLKKPSVSAWAVNQLARAHQVEIRRLIKAGESLQAAQRGALSGQAADFSRAKEEESEAIRRLGRALTELAPGATSATLERAVNSLRAGAATEAGRLLIKQGRLTEDLAPSGFESLGAVTATDQLHSSRKPSPRVQSLRRRLGDAEAAAKTAVAEAADLDRQAQRAEREAAGARRAADAARQKADRAQELRERLSRELAGQ